MAPLGHSISLWLMWRSCTNNLHGTHRPQKNEDSKTYNGCSTVSRTIPNYSQRWSNLNEFTRSPKVFNYRKLNMSNSCRNRTPNWNPLLTKAIGKGGPRPHKKRKEDL